MPDTPFVASESNWPVHTLGELCKLGGGDIQTGPFGSQLHASDYVDEGVPSIMPKNIGDNRVSTEDIAHITEEDARRLERYRVRLGDIVYSRRGDVEKRSLIRAREDGWLCGTGCLRVRPGEAGLDSDYLSYYLAHPSVRSWIVQHAIGATMPNLNTTILSDLPVVAPPHLAQKRIAHILGTLDDKIELNRQMNRTLEAIARAIFKSWFIDFDPVIDNAILNGKPIPDEFAERAEVRREILARSQPSPPTPLPEVEGGNYRGGFEFAGLVEKARELRQRQTPAEEILWELLRDRQFLSLKFRRQHQIGDYIADFYCHERKLVIEVDGGIHQTQEVTDAKRNAYMQTLGLTVLRIPNADVLNSIEDALSRIAEAAGKSPSTSGRGARGEGVAGYRHLFPDSFQDSPLGRIPKGWDTAKLGEVLSLEYGKALKATIRKPGNVPVYGSNGQVGWHDESLVRGPGIVVGRKGNPGTVTWVQQDFFPIDTTFYVAPKTKSLPMRFLFHVLEAENLPALAADSAVPGLNRNIAYENPIHTPPEPLTHCFRMLCEGLLLRVESNEAEARALAGARDAFLPQLLSGKLQAPRQNDGGDPHD